MLGTLYSVFDVPERPYHQPTVYSLNLYHSTLASSSAVFSCVSAKDLSDIGSCERNSAKGFHMSRFHRFTTLAWEYSPSPLESALAMGPNRTAPAARKPRSVILGFSMYCSIPKKKEFHSDSVNKKYKTKPHITQQNVYVPS